MIAATKPRPFSGNTAAIGIPEKCCGTGGTPRGGTGAQAPRMMCRRCACAGPVVTPSSDLENIYFEIPNAPFAESFASINGLA